MRIIRLMHRNKLMTNQVVSRREARGDRACPEQRVEDGVAGPDARVFGAGDEAFLVDFDCGERVSCGLDHDVMMGIWDLHQTLPEPSKLSQSPGHLAM